MADSDLSRVLNYLRDLGSQFSTLSSQLTTLSGKVDAVVQQRRSEGQTRRPVTGDLKTEPPRARDRDRVLREVASGIAHNFNNVLAIIVGQAQLMLKQIEDPSIRERLDTVKEAASRAAEMIRRLQSFATPREPDTFVPVDLNTVIQDAVAVTYPSRREAETHGFKVEVVTDLREVPPIPGNPAELREMVFHLLSNAIEAMPTGGRVIIESRPAGGLVEVSLSDSGMGIPEAVRPHIFDPFFTTKGPRCSGLGLSVVQGILARHGGEVEISSDDGRGTTFVLRLPVGPAGAAVQPALPIPQPERPARPRGPTRVLPDRKIQAGNPPQRGPVDKPTKKKGTGRLQFVVSRERPDLYNYLTWHFSGEKDVEVILDRREKDPAQTSESRTDDDLFGFSGVVTRYIEVEEPVSAGHIPATPEERGAPGQMSGSFCSKTILVVDDEPMVANLVAQMLALDGYEVETAPDGVAALKKLQERDYDLILSDLRMPELNGEGLYLEVMRQKPKLGRRFIFLTGSAAPSETRHFLERSGPPHLTKPFDLETLRRVVRRTLATAEDASMVGDPESVW